MTPAEERAEREGLPVVLVMPVEAYRIAEGHPMICETKDGASLLVRLYTSAEIVAAIANAQREASS